MRVVIQRVSRASVSIGGAEKSSIGNGLMILLGIEDSDGQSDIEWLCAKIANLDAFLRERLGIDVEVNNPFQNIIVNEKKFDPEYVQEIGPRAAVAVGLALRKAGDR